jgi:hypothetical protein
MGAVEPVWRECNLFREKTLKPLAALDTDTSPYRFLSG